MNYVDQPCPVIERVGDGFGDPSLTMHVAEAIPFMQFAIEDTTMPNNLTGRTPSNDPDHWLAVNNCGSTSKALATFLGKVGYDARLMCAQDDSHMLVQVETEDQTVNIDPTALQFLNMFEVRANNNYSNERDDFSGQLLPTERVLIFKPENYTEVAEWMATVVKRYWQTKTLGLYAAGFMGMSPGERFRRHQATDVSQAKIAECFADLYHPANFKPYTGMITVDYGAMYSRWISGETTRAI